MKAFLGTYDCFEVISMKNSLKKGISLLLCCVLAMGSMIPIYGKDLTLETVGRPSVNCKSAILMEASTGRILFEQNAEEALPPASVTKIMTLLLVMEAIEAGLLKYEDVLSASAYACSMGGSQIYLEEGEQMSVDDLIKSVVIASANDAAVVLAESVSGTESAFVEKMNARARQLGMTKTNFENTNGLDDTATNHVTSAKDIAIMSRELIRHKKILEYSSIWMDTIRNGEFGLTNTNRLVRFYKGATGLKTGSTAKAGFCISATAERDGMSLICVIMGAESRDIRNAAATSLLDWGFANYVCYDSGEPYKGELSVLGGVQGSCRVASTRVTTMVEKNDIRQIQTNIELPQSITAPISKGQIIGSITYTVNGKMIAKSDICSEEEIPKIDFWGVWLTLLRKMLTN